MKISELITTLQTHLARRGDIEVLTTWETIIRRIDEECVYPSPAEMHGRVGDVVLLIDADLLSYKEDFELKDDAGGPT